MAIFVTTRRPIPPTGTAYYTYGVVPLDFPADGLVAMQGVGARPVELVGGDAVAALTSLVSDRVHKSSLHARAGRPEYWIVNLIDRVLEVHRDPAPSASAPYGWDYGRMEALGVGDMVRPLAAPAARIAVADLLP